MSTERREDEVIAEIGHVQLRGVRRQPGDSARAAFEALASATRHLGDELLKTAPGRVLIRALTWLSRRSRQ
jgi:hypothetical protein